MAVIGLDVGTTQVKCGVFDDSGKQIAIYSLEYSIFVDKQFQYANTEKMWENVKNVLRQAAQQNNIEAICVTSFGESFVAVTKDFKILGNSMLYTDSRGTQQANALKKKISDTEAFNISGNIIHPMYALPKIMWLKINQAEIYNSADYLLPIGSFITFMLSGSAVTDYSLAARTLLFDIAEKKWSKRMLSLGEVSEDKLPKAVISGSVVGKLRGDIATQLGINLNCQIVTGGHDQVCSALGAGVLESGSCVDGIGTVECITPVFAHQPKDDNMINSGLSCVPYVVDGMYVTYMFNYTCGALIKWFRDKIVPEGVAALKTKGENFYDFYANQMTSLPTGLLVLPHFNGAATPYMDTAAKGAILNMDITTTAADIYKGIMEGCSYEMRLNADSASKSGIKINSLTATGGGANSKQWLQIKADIMGVPVYPLECADAGIAGCAILALAAIGKAKKLKDAVDMVVRKKEPYLPNKANMQVYDTVYLKYKKLYKLLKEIR